MFSLFAGQGVCSCCSADSSAFSSEVIGSHVFASLMRMVGFKSRQTTQSHCRAKCFQFYLAFIIFALRVLGISGYYRGLSPSSYFILQLCNVVIFAQASNWSLMPPTDANASRVFAQLALWFRCIADGENNLISKSTSLTIHGNSRFVGGILLHQPAGLNFQIRNLAICAKN